MPSVFIKTYGCQMNERDSEAVSAQLMAKGYEITRDESRADVVLLNTCSVRDLAEQKAIWKMSSVIGQARKNNPGQVFGFMGCMAQSRGKQLIEQLPDVDLVVGTQKIHRIADYLAELTSGQRQKVVEIGEEAGSQAAIREHLLGGSGAQKAVTAFVSIMQGCNQHCTFCIVPQTRGEERSRSIPDIVAECRELVSQGVKEITLLGQIVTSFGRRDYPVVDGKGAFVQLIEAVHDIEGLQRIRFTSPHPKGYGDDLVQAYGRLPKLVESAHLPVQSGSNRILKAMHRGYTRERFLELVAKLRAVRPGMGLSTDIIVGFPGETEEDFEETVALCQEVRFEMVFLFKYSQRKDTPAAGMSGQLPEEVIEARHRRLLDLTNQIGREKYDGFVGRKVEILVEGVSHKNGSRMEGRTRCNKIVVFPGDNRHRGEVMEVRVERVGTFTLYADPAVVNLGPDEVECAAPLSTSANATATATAASTATGPVIEAP